MYDENQQKNAHKIRNTDELLFDDAISYLQKGDSEGLRSIFEKLKKDSLSNPDGWLFEGCYYFLLYVEQEKGLNQDFDDDLELSDVLKNARSSLMRAFKYTEDEELLKKYFECIGYSLGHMSSLMLFSDDVNQVLQLLSDIHDTVKTSVGVSECYHIVFLGVGSILKTMDSIDRESSLFESTF